MEAYVTAMRSIVLLATVALAALLAIALAFAWYRSPARLAPAPVAQITPPALESPTATTAIERVPNSSPPGTIAPNPLTKTGWGPEDRETIAGYVEVISQSDADFLCLTLGLVSRDELFDDISYRRRLRRHLARISSPDEFKDMEAAFRQLAQMRGAKPRPFSPPR